MVYQFSFKYREKLQHIPEGRLYNLLRCRSCPHDYYLVWAFTTYHGCHTSYFKTYAEERNVQAKAGKFYRFTNFRCHVTCAGFLNCIYVFEQHLSSAFLCFIYFRKNHSSPKFLCKVKQKLPQKRKCLILGIFFFIIKIKKNDSELLSHSESFFLSMTKTKHFLLYTTFCHYSTE